MADNVDITPGTGATVAADLIAGALHQRMKISQGADGSATDVSSAAPLEVTIANTAANTTAVKVNVASGGIASGAIASGAVASGAFAAGAMADGANVTLGTKTDAKSTATDGTSTSLISIEKQISASAQILAAGVSSNLYQAKLTDGTNAPAVKAASTAPAATDPALVVAISPNSVNANGQATMANSAPVAIASNQSAVPISAASASIASGAIASGAVASGAFASGSVGSGAIASGAIASGAIASGAVASGAIASGSIVDGASVTLGAKADAKNSATDTTSITLMQVAKQISASAQIIAAPGLNSRVSVTRPSNTNTYGAGDVLGPTGGGTASITFALGAVSGSNIMITSARLQRNVTAVISGETTYQLHFFNATQPGAQVDEDTFTVASGDQAAYLGFITFPALTDVGATIHSNLENINKQVKLGATTSLFGVLVTVGSYVAASASVLVVDLSAIQL